MLAKMTEMNVNSSNMTVPIGRNVDYCPMNNIGKVITFNYPYVFFLGKLIAENTNCYRNYSFATFVLRSIKQIKRTFVF